MTNSFPRGRRISFVENGAELFGVVTADDIFGDDIYNVHGYDGKERRLHVSLLEDAEKRAPKPVGLIGRDITLRAAYGEVTGRCINVTSKRIYLVVDGDVWDVKIPKAEEEKVRKKAGKVA